MPTLKIALVLSIPHKFGMGLPAYAHTAQAALPHVTLQTLKPPLKQLMINLGAGQVIDIRLALPAKGTGADRRNEQFYEIMAFVDAGRRAELAEVFELHHFPLGLAGEAEIVVLGWAVRE
jgi:hypothetical protein